MREFFLDRLGKGLCILLLAQLGLFSSCQPKQPLPPQPTYDYPAMVSDSSWAKVIGDREYKRYSRELPRTKAKEPKQSIGTPDLNPGIFGKVFRLLSYVLGVIALGMLIWWLLTKMPLNRSLKIKSPQDELEALIAQSDDVIESQLQGWQREQDYRQAIRMRYVKLLKSLSKDRQIKILPGKTNLEYKNELKQPEMAAGFDVLAKAYLYAFFSGKTVLQEDFEQFDKHALDLENRSRSAARAANSKPTSQP